MIAQVHKAVLKSGESVVVKIQRPGLKALFDIDLEQLRILAKRLVVLTKLWRNYLLRLSGITFER